MADAKPTADELAAQAGFVHALAKSLLFDRHRAADVAQDALVDALKDDRAPRRTLRAWLAGVVRNRARQSLRGDRRRKGREERAARTVATPAAADAVAQLEIQRRLVEAVQSLPEIYRTVIVLRYFHNRPPRRIAHELKITSSAAKSRLKRALHMLREALDAGYGARRTWCLAFAPLLVAKPVSAATAAVGGGTQLLLGGLAMKAGTVVTATVTISAGLVGVAVLQTTDEEPSPRTRAVTAMEEPQVADRESPTPPRAGETPDGVTPDSNGRTRTRPAAGSLRGDTGSTGASVDASATQLRDEARETAVRYEQLKALQRLRDMEAQLSAAAFANAKRKEPRPKKPDPNTQRYLQALAVEFGGMEEGDERRELLDRFARLHNDYLKRTGDTSLLPFVESAMDRALSAREQSRLVDAVKNSPEPACAEVLVHWADHENSDVRARAVQALRRVRGDAARRAHPRITQALADPAPDVRAAAAKAYGGVHSKSQGTEPLLQALRVEKDLGAARWLARAVIQVDPKQGVQRLRDIGPDVSANVRKVLEKETKNVVSSVRVRVR